MKKAIVFLLLGVFVVVPGELFAASKRTAIIEDTKGIVSEVTGLDFSRIPGKFYATYNRIGVSTSIFEIAIPLDSVISIKAKGGSVNVRYQYRGKEKTIIGKLMPGKFRGKSDFGDMEFSTSKLSKLTFKEPPIPSAEKEIASFDATIVLTDGSKVPVANLKRYYVTMEEKLFTTTIGVEKAYKLVFNHKDDIRFFRGESLATVGFEKIKNITFQPDKKVTVTLKNGKQATGTLSTEDEDDVYGFTGIYEKGDFFIEPNHVKAIDFGATGE